MPTRRSIKELRATLIGRIAINRETLLNLIMNSLAEQNRLAQPDTKQAGSVGYRYVVEVETWAWPTTTSAGTGRPWTTCSLTSNADRSGATW
jgi:hypothetical protein